MTIRNFWACDFSKNTGEGNLARLYINQSDGKQKILSVKTFIKNSTIRKIFDFKYISPFFGVLICWYFFFQKKEITYVNYLPLWNFFIFLLLPPKTKIGPITGGAIFEKKSQYFVRKYIFPKFYKISEKIILFRYKKIIFSTSLLKQYLSPRTKKKCQFNFILNYIKINKLRKKSIDFLIYYRKHKNKKNLYNYSFLDEVCKKNKKIYIVGDTLKIQNAKNLGYISNKKLLSLLAKTRFTISSNENIFSLFNIECINNNVKIFVEKKNIPKVKNLAKKFISIN